jgi:hypothetical protein
LTFGAKVKRGILGVGTRMNNNQSRRIDNAEQ